jgi:hypothetical protein
MKLSLLTSGFLLAGSLLGHGAILLTENFDGYAENAPLSSPWAQNDPTSDPIDFMQTPAGGSRSLVVGGSLAFPDTQMNTEWSHPLQQVPVNGTAISLDFALRENGGSPNNADSFGFTLRDNTGADIYRFSLDSYKVAGNYVYGQRNITSYIGSAPGTVITSPNDVLVYNGGPTTPGYTLNLSFTTSGTDLLVSGTIGSHALNSTIPNFGTKNLGSFVIDWDLDVAPTTQAGFNDMFVDNILVTNPVPEPSASLLGGLGILGLLGRRRRK